MKPYNERSPCEKCGSHFVTTRFERGPVGDVIRRKCVRCGYGWAEAPIDTKKKINAVKPALR